ncbi:hypothetical protein [Archangium sp.]|uniref:hypothetical protein n=1 Tax=Archangium sp. TaxID=1872627 RepID=UPI003899EE21
MHDRGFKRWVVLGALASASWLASACGALPQQAGNDSFSPGFVRGSSPQESGNNGTIKDLPTSIDPRTPQAQGTPNRSLPYDPGEMALLKQSGELGLGGSGSTVEGQGPEMKQIEPANDKPAAESVPGETLEPAGANKPLPRNGR